MREILPRTRVNRRQEEEEGVRPSLASSEGDHRVGLRITVHLQVEGALGYEWVHQLAYLPGRLGLVEGLREWHLPV